MPAAPPLLGTYTPPRLRRGDRVHCLYRDALCVVTTIHDGRIPWPRCRALASRGGSGLLVTEELVRAIRTESAAALMHHFGVSTRPVWNWRRRFLTEAGKFGTPGSWAAHQKAASAGAKAMKAKEWSDEELARKAAVSKGRRGPPRWTPDRGGWTPKELALLGTAPDAEVAARIGRTRDAVRATRVRAGIPPAQ